jgi:hypothetical protein
MIKAIRLGSVLVKFGVRLCSPAGFACFFHAPCISTFPA